MGWLKVLGCPVLEAFGRKFDTPRKRPPHFCWTGDMVFGAADPLKTQEGISRWSVG